MMAIKLLKSVTMAFVIAPSVTSFAKKTQERLLSVVMGSCKPEQGKSVMQEFIYLISAHLGKRVAYYVIQIVA